MKRIIIKGGRVIDPASRVDGLFDIEIIDGRIKSVNPAGNLSPAKDDEVIDAAGKLVVPGLVDIHTHLREPGYEYKETIATGTQSAAAGGVTSVCVMANTDPVNDNASVTRFILKKAQDEGVVNVFPIGAVTMGLKGERLTEMVDLGEAGAVAFSDDGMPIESPSLMRRALEYSRILDVPVVSHAEDHSLVASGNMNEGEYSTKLGLKGIPNASEDVMVARDVSLAELTGAKLHIAHVSTWGSVDIIRAAKERGVKVTAEVTPHHLALDHSSLLEYDTNKKMNPPLRSDEDRQALIDALASGVIDAVATDHAPHSPVEKDVEFDCAANGVVGLETSLAIALSLVEAGRIGLSEMIAAMTINPSKIFGLDKGTLGVGSAADIAIVDMDEEWVVEPEKLRSRSKNTAFAGMKLKGRVVRTIVNGKTVFSL